MVNTRRTRRDITPPSQVIYKEHSTKKRIRFYDTLDSRKPKESVPSFATRFGIARSTVYYLIEQRKKFGDNAYHHTRKLSNNLGPPLRHSPETYKQLVDPASNPVRDQVYKVQLQYHNIRLKPRQLGRNLRRYTKQARRYKQAYVKKQISPSNKTKRVQYRRVPY
ncbi:hypothetical protein ACMFMG_009972 [Clarireedia jacksonii]